MSRAELNAVIAELRVEAIIAAMTGEPFAAMQFHAEAARLAGLRDEARHVGRNNFRAAFCRRHGAGFIHP